MSNISNSKSTATIYLMNFSKASHLRPRSSPHLQMCECLLIPIKLMHQQLYTRTRPNMTEIKAQHFHIGFGRMEITPLVTLRIRDPFHYIKEPGDPQLVIRSKINRMRGQQIYTEPSSQRANFSPFTKDYRELGLSCEQLQFLSSGLPDLSTKQKKLLYTIISPFLSFPPSLHSHSSLHFSVAPLPPQSNARYRVLSFISHLLPY